MTNSKAETGGDRMMAHGHVEACLVGPNGERTPVCVGSNTLSYRCADAVARLFAGDISYRPQKIAFITDTSGTGGLSFTSGERGQKEEDIVTTGYSTANVDIEPNPSFSHTAAPADMVDTSVYYQGNSVTLRATLSTESEDYVYGFMLKDGNDNILATKAVTKITKPADYALSVAWTVTFV